MKKDHKIEYLVGNKFITIKINQIIYNLKLRIFLG